MSNQYTPILYIVKYSSPCYSNGMGDCPVQKTAALLSDTWTMLIIRDLLAGPRRFCDLERSLEGISTRTLTLKIKTLEKERLVKKTKDGGYGVTARGKGLRTVESAMRRYGEKYL